MSDIKLVVSLIVRDACELIAEEPAAEKRIVISTDDLEIIVARHLEQLINTPEIEDFMRAVPLEAAHQVERWGSEHDAGKSPFDWYWVLGHLGSKAAHSMLAGDVGKAKHHCITVAALALNWHRHLKGEGS